ncbi:MAG: hypothetical protein ABIP61_07620, partial [Burkholderiaceae bacterium]
MFAPGIVEPQFLAAQATQSLALLAAGRVDAACNRKTRLALTLPGRKVGADPRAFQNDAFALERPIRVRQALHAPTQDADQHQRTQAGDR